MPPLNALAATTATADVDVELADQGTSRDFRLILYGNLCFPDGATALRARVRQGCLQDFIDSRGAGGQAVAVAPVVLAGFAAGRLGLWLGRPLGEGCGLAFGLALSLVEAGAGPFEFALEAFVLLAKAFVLLAKAFVLLAELLDLARSCCNSSRTEKGTDTGSNTLIDAIAASSLHIRLDRYSASPRRKRQGGANQVRLKVSGGTALDSGHSN